MDSPPPDNELSGYTIIKSFVFMDVHLWFISLPHMHLNKTMGMNVLNDGVKKTTGCVMNGGTTEAGGSLLLLVFGFHFLELLEPLAKLALCLLNGSHVFAKLEKLWMLLALTVDHLNGSLH